MTIEIIETRVVTDLETGGTSARLVEIIISSNGDSYLWTVGGLPVEGNLQTILDGREAELLAAAQAGGRSADLYELALKRVLKAFALVVLDEVNILRQRANLTPRTAGQINDAIKAKLKGMS